MKTLKTMLAMIATLAMCVGIFSGCQANNPEPQSGNDPTTTVAATTTTEMTTTTEATTTTTEPAVVYTVNEDRLAEIGKTFAELKEQYGEVIDSYWWNGGMRHSFERSECAYFFDKSVEWGGLPTEDAICQNIFDLYAEKLFNGLTETVSDTEFAEMYGLEHLWSEQMEFYADNYMSDFRYGDYEILIRANENYQIGPDSKIVYIRPTRNSNSE